MGNNSGHKSYGLIAEVVNRGGHAGYPEQEHYDHSGQETWYSLEIPRTQWRPLGNLQSCEMEAWAFYWGIERRVLSKATEYG